MVVKNPAPRPVRKELYRLWDIKTGKEVIVNHGVDFFEHLRTGRFTNKPPQGVDAEGGKIVVEEVQSSSRPQLSNIVPLPDVAEDQVEQEEADETVSAELPVVEPNSLEPESEEVPDTSKKITRNKVKR